MHMQNKQKVFLLLTIKTICDILFIEEKVITLFRICTRLIRFHFILVLF